MSSPPPRKSSESLRSSVASPPCTAFARSPQHASHHAILQRQSSYQHPRRESTTSVTPSIGGTLDTTGANTVGEVNEYAQNAISTLLSPPIVRTGLVPHTSLPVSSAQRPPSARDIPPVTLTPIPHVDSSAFKPYLAQVGPLFDTFQRAKAASEEASQHLLGRDRPSDKDDDFSEVFGRHVRRKDSASSVTSAISPPPSPFSVKSPQAEGRRRTPGAPATLSTIPSVYFEEKFQLENPRIFDVVSEYAEVVPPDRPGTRDGSGEANGKPKGPVPMRRKALHTNAILQEKLSWYMDTVELHLISSIATASSSFFAALESLKELEAEAADSITEIKSLRSALQTLDSEMAMGGLEVVKKRRRRENVGRLTQAVDQVCEVVEGAKRCEDLVDEGDVEAATKHIDDLEHLIAGTSPDGNQEAPRIDLRQVQALDGIHQGISGLRFRIGRGFEARFIEALLSDLRDHVQKVPSKDTMQRWANTSLRSRGDHNRARSTIPQYLHNNEQLRPSLNTALAGLSRAGHTGRAASAYRDAVMREIKSMIRRHLPSSNDDDAESTTSVSTRGSRKLSQQEKSAILARNLRSLDMDAAEELLVNVYTDIGEALRRLGFQVKVVLDVTSTLEHPPEADSSNQADASHIREEMTQALDLSSLLGQAVDVVQGQVMKVLKVRGDQNTRLPLDYFLRYFMLNRLFADECEAVSSQSGEALKAVVNSQVKEFLSVVTEAEKHDINQTLEADAWEAKDFTPTESTLLANILESMTQTPKAWSSYTLLWNSDPPLVPTINGTPATNGETNSPDPSSTTTAKPTVRPAQIEHQKYLLTTSSHALLPGLTHFSHLIAAIPTLTPDAASRLLEYLKLFNSRACQLVLGAGATKSAGLRNINTKHLALASQACSFVVALLPYLREFCRRHLPSGGGAAGAAVLAEFDRTKRLFQDHQASIHEKLVEIMGGRCAVAVASSRKVEYDALAAAERTGEATAPSAWVETLSKETTTLHRVLGRHVSELDLRMIMIPIFVQYRDEWGSAISDAVRERVKTEAGRRRLRKDVEVFAERMGRIDEEEGKSLRDALVGVLDAAGGTTQENGEGTGHEAGAEEKDMGDAGEKLKPPGQGHNRLTSVDIIGGGVKKPPDRDKKISEEG